MHVVCIQREMGKLIAMSELWRYMRVGDSPQHIQYNSNTVVDQGILKWGFSQVEDKRYSI